MLMQSEICAECREKCGSKASVGVFIVSAVIYCWHTMPDGPRACTEKEHHYNGDSPTCACGTRQREPLAL